MFSLPGYDVYATIHESHRTVVYRGRRAGEDRSVVLKTHRPAYPTQADVSRLRREYEIGRRVDAPGVVATYALEEHGHSLVLVREDFDGIALREAIPPGGI